MPMTIFYLLLAFLMAEARSGPWGERSSGQAMILGAQSRDGRTEARDVPHRGEHAELDRVSSGLDSTR
jgi:hypothetical protein